MKIKQPPDQRRQQINLCALFLLFISTTFAIGKLVGGQAEKQLDQGPSPIRSASYISLDGLTLVITFDRPVNLSAAIESVQQRQAAAQAAAYDSVASHETALTQLESSARQTRTSSSNYNLSRGSFRNKNKPTATFQRAAHQHLNHEHLNHPLGDELISSSSSHASSSRTRLKAQRQAGLCRELVEETAISSQETQQLVAGVQLCAQQLTRKTLKLLHKYKLHNCLWASQVQFLIQLNRPIGASSQQQQPSAPETVRIAFRRNTLSELSFSDTDNKPRNEQETVVELSRLALEALGLPLSPRLALTGPNQVAPCGRFSISAHLSSPSGTHPNESVRLQWSVERAGLIAAANSTTAPSTAQRQKQSAGQSDSGQLLQTASDRQATQAELAELQWQTLKQHVASQTGNNLVLDAELMQFMPQLYEFRLTVTFTTSLTSFVLNATHQMGRLDFDAPIGTIYGTHLLSSEQHLNANSHLALMADVQVPACAQNIKQVGLYWQVSDPRVRFEQTYAPVYYAKSGALPEQAHVEFRLNLFYGIRVKKFASASTTVVTGDSILDAEISDGLLTTSIGQPQDLVSSSNSQTIDNQLVLFAVSQNQDQQQQQDKYTYQWTCFDGRTAQSCYKSLKLQASSGGTRYDLGANQQQNALVRPQQASTGQSVADSQGATGASSSSLLLVDKTRQRQPVLRLPLSWFESDAQLWFGLQRFDRQNPSQQSKTEYTLVSVHPLQANADRHQQSAAPQVAIGPVLVGRARQRATIRNPLTGAIVLVADVPVVIVGRLSPANLVGSFVWRLPNYLHPLHWTRSNVTNSLSQQEEIVTELHLNQETLLAYGQHQVQLIVCGRHTGERILASISLDVVQGVSQCRVELASSLQQQQQPAGLSSAPTLPGGATDRQAAAPNLNVQKQAADGGGNLPLVVTVNYCNIPLGLSPLTYQLYTIDTSGSDGFIESSKPVAAAEGRQQAQEKEDYTNELDEQLYESLARPFNGPQLSPVFTLAGLGQLALMSTLHPKGPTSAPNRMRFGVRVCDRLHSCRMFYSDSLDLLAALAVGSQPTGSSVLLEQQGAGGAARSERLEAQPNVQRELINRRQQAIDSLRNMLEAAKRANTAGNSIAAISILNVLMTLAQRMLLQADANPQSVKTTTTTTTTDRLKAGARETTSGVSYSRDQADEQQQQLDNDQTGQMNEEQLERLRDLLQVAMRDCLHYGIQSSQRQFHYFESGQTNLALAAMVQILASQRASFELKLRSLRLVVLLIRKSLDNQQQAGQPKLQSVPDLKTIQLVYESLFNAISQHTTSAGGTSGILAQATTNNVAAISAMPPGGVATAAAARGGEQDRHRVKRLAVEHNRQDELHRLASDDNKIPSRRLLSPSKSNSSSEWRPGLASAASTLPSDLSRKADFVGGELISTGATTITTTTVAQRHSTSLKANRRNKEEAVLAYLRLVRHAHRSLLQAIAVQLPLGAVQHFEYQSVGSQAPLASSANNNQQHNNVAATAAANKFVAMPQPAAYIVSSLTRQTDLVSDTIDVDLRAFGSVSVSFGEPAASVLTKLGREMRQSKMRCKNDTQTKCSSFVLALTSFAGKAPFRSLDFAGGRASAPRLRIPIVQLDWLSPVDGSNLIELLETPDGGDPVSDGDKRLTPSDFQATVTFTLPPQIAGNMTEGRGETPSVAESDGTAKGASYKCYKFDESTNEWVALSEASEERVPLDEQASSSAARQLISRLRCSFDGFGVVGVFQGKPPPLETSTELSIALGVACVLAVVTIISLLGCISSKAKSKHSSNNNLGLDVSTDSSRASGATYESDPDDERDGGRQRSRRNARLEQSMAFR